VSEEKFVDLYKLVEPELRAQLRGGADGTFTDRLNSTATAVAHALGQVGRRHHSSVADSDQLVADARRQHADALLAAIGRGFECLNAVSVSTAGRREQGARRDAARGGARRGAPLGWGGLAAVVAIVVATGIAVSGTAALIALGTALIAMIAAGGARWESAERRRLSRSERASREVAPVSFSIDERRLCDAIADALLEADEATVQLLRMSRRSAAPSGGLAEDKTILTTVQSLLGADLQRDNVEVHMRVKELRAALVGRGISVVAFDGSNDDLFDFERPYETHVTEPTTLVPALTSRGRPLMRGRAVRPDTRLRMEGALQ
jgi:hypothetical protein